MTATASRRTFQHLTSTGELERRTSATKLYTHVVVGTIQDGEWAGRACVLRWSESAANAARAARSRELSFARDLRVEAINGGEAVSS